MCELETIPEEGELPRISELIPKSPETIKREIEYERLCDKYLDDQTLKFYYTMLVTNKKFRQLYPNTDGRIDKSCQTLKCKIPGQMQKRNIMGSTTRTVAITAVPMTASIPLKSPQTCDVQTSIPTEDIQHFFSGKTDDGKSTVKPLNNSNSVGMVNRSNSNKGDCFDGNGNGISTIGKYQNQVKTVQTRTVSTSIPIEDIRMLCENLVSFNNRRSGHK